MARPVGRSGVTRSSRRPGDLHPRSRCLAARGQGLRAQRLQDRNRSPRDRPRADAGGCRHRPVAVQQENPVSRSSPMPTYIGTAISRVDGRAKVTGAAKYAGEFNTAGLAHASVVTSTIAKGRITRIVASEALSVEGVIDVLTHQHRPPMASADSAYKDEVPREGLPFRPLYDDRIWFSGQPVALVVAEEPEIARFAASLVRVEYDE